MKKETLLLCIESTQVPELVGAKGRHPEAAPTNWIVGDWLVFQENV